MSAGLKAREGIHLYRIIYPWSIVLDSAWIGHKEKNTHRLGTLKSEPQNHFQRETNSFFNSRKIVQIRGNLRSAERLR